MEIPSERPPIINDEHNGHCEHTMHDELKIKREKQLPNSGNLITDGQTKLLLPSEVKSQNMGSIEVDDEANEHLGFSERTSEDKKESEAHSENLEPAAAKHEFCGHARLSELHVLEDKREIKSKGEEEKQWQSTDAKRNNCNIVLETSPNLEKKRALACKPNPDGVAGRLRQRHQKTNGQGIMEPTGVKEKNSDGKHSVNMFSNKEEPKEEELLVEDDKCTDRDIVLDISPKLNKKTARTVEPNPDSIGGRLRQRRRMGQGNEEIRV